MGARRCPLSNARGNRIVAVTEPPWYDGSTCEAYYGGSLPSAVKRLWTTALLPLPSRHGMTALHAKRIMVARHRPWSHRLWQLHCGCHRAAMV